MKSDKDPLAKKPSSRAGCGGEKKISSKGLGQSFKTGIALLCIATHLAYGAVPANRNEIPEVMRLSESRESAHPASVYVYGDQSLDNLIPVRVLGAVGKAGIHYVPARLDLLTLLSVAGGTLMDAELEEVTIKREESGKHQVIAANVEELVSATDAVVPILKANDTVFVPHQKTWISENLSRTVTLVVGITSIAVSVVAISSRR